MPTVVLHRSDEFTNRLRNYRIYINRKKVGVISNGDTDQFSVAAGVHYLVAKIDHCRSKTVRFHIAPNEEVHFYVSGFKYANTLVFIGLGFSLLWFVLHKYFGVNFLLVVPAAVFALLGYFFTIGSKRYLRLEQMTSETDAPPTDNASIQNK